MNTVIRKGYPHCGYLAAHTKEYVEEIERHISCMEDDIIAIMKGRLPE